MSDIYLVRVENNPDGTGFGVENANDLIHICRIISHSELRWHGVIEV